MISPKEFFEELQNIGVEFFTGVPDSLLKNFCSFISTHTSNRNHIIAANEGGAIGLAMGYYLATGKPPLVYMQNSGLGNATNPLISLVDPDVYSIPILLLIGWRGEPGYHDEPQHVKQGKITISLLETMGIPYTIIDLNTKNIRDIIYKAYNFAVTQNCPYAFVVRANTFETYRENTVDLNKIKLTRERALEIILDSFPDAIYISTTGKISREVYEIRNKKNQEHSRDFLCVGGMGHASQIALGLALYKQDREIICLDGDGAALMHLGNMAIIGQSKVNNYIHIILNNGVHESVGSQPTVAFNINLVKVAESFGYLTVGSCDDEETLLKKINEIGRFEVPTFLEVRVNTHSRKDLGRPKTTPQQNKESFMRFIK